MSGQKLKGIERSHASKLSQEVYPNGVKRGDPEVQCKYCQHRFRAGAGRIRSHLLGTKDGVSACSEVPDIVTYALKRKQTEKSEETAAKKRKQELDLQTRSSSDPETSDSSKVNPISTAYAKVDKAGTDAAIARYFYDNGLPFHSARSQTYVDMVHSINRMPPGYNPPNVKQLREGLLIAEKARIDAQLQSCIDSSAQTGTDLTSDGWQDASHRPLLNILLVTPKGAQFVKALTARRRNRLFVLVKCTALFYLCFPSG